MLRVPGLGFKGSRFKVKVQSLSFNMYGVWFRAQGSGASGF